jgi:hypothetical protein
MTYPTPRPTHIRRYLAPAILAMFAAVSLGSATVGAAVLPVGTTPYAMAALPTGPMVLQNVTLADITANKNGICNGGFTHVIKNTDTASNARNYLKAAQACGLKVIFYFSKTVSAAGTVYPSRVASWVKVVKNSPALFGYLSVKEPGSNHISTAEIRALYKAFHKADPGHPVIALFGDIPHFNMKGNYWGTGMANILMVDWYPVETASNGCSRTGVDVVSTSAKHLKHVHAVILAKTPRTPVWLMVQTHKYLGPSCHKKQRPTEAQLRKQVRDGFAYAKAVGIAFHTFENTNYQIDNRRDPTMVGWMRAIANEVHAGTFQ